MLLPESTMIAPTPPLPSDQVSAPDKKWMSLAIDQAALGAQEGGIPIGAALVGPDDQLLGVGRNRRIQQGSAIKHGETDCLENVGRLPASAFRNATMYTTLSPCPMCAGAIILFGIKRVVMGENTTFTGGEDILRSRGVELINLDSPRCKQLMGEFIASNPKVWNEDIGELDP